MKFDLHVHTNHSDGIFSPKDIVDLARSINLDGIAITDHDITSGLQDVIEYSKGFKDLKIIPGIEFGCVHQGEEVHILGYYIDYKNSKLIKVTEKLKKAREERGIKIIEKLNQLGFKINIEDVKKLTKNNFIGRDHIARALTNKGYTKNVEEAFEKYLKLGGPAYVKRYKITIEETINLIIELNGIAVLAHPGLINNKKILSYCVEKGIKGIEAIHPRHSKNDVQYLLNFAYENKLLTTGGSDFHGNRGNGDLRLGKYYVGNNIILQLKGMI